MAALPENNTGVYFLDYTFNGEERSMQFRHAAGTTVPQLGFYVSQFVNALGPLLCEGWAITGARYRAEGSNVTLPTEAPATPADSNILLSPVANPRFVTFTGRGSTSGRRVRIFVYGLVFNTPDDYRFNVGENSTLAAARTELDSANSGYFTTIAGDDPLWYLYFNVGYNSYHERKQRL